MTAEIAGTALAALGLVIAAVLGRWMQPRRLPLVLSAITGAFGTGALVLWGLFDALSLPLLVVAMVVYGLAVAVTGRMMRRG